MKAYEFSDNFHKEINNWWLLILNKK